MSDERSPPRRKFIAHGAAAEVWLVDASGTDDSDQKGSVKALQLWEDFMGVFKSKVDQWKPLSHGNVVRIFGLEEELGLRVEYLAHGTASQYLLLHQNSANLTPLRMEMIKNTLAGMNYLHSCDPPVVHGSIRMDKLFVDEAGTTKIGEFGLAPLLEDFEFSVPSVSLAGHIRWMSPELLEADKDQRPAPTMASDVWALGCTLFEIISGKLPYFKCKHDLRVRREIISKKHPGNRDNLFSPDLAEIWTSVPSCWEWEPKNRPSVEKLVESIGRAISRAKAEDEPGPNQSKIIETGDTESEVSEIVLSSLSGARSAGQHLEKLEDIQTEIESLTRALSQTTDGDSNMPRLLLHLGKCHQKAFEISGNSSDIDKAIEYTVIALNLAPDGDPELSDLLSHLGTLHVSRYERLGELDDLEQAIEYESRALALIPDGHPHLPGMLANLAVSYTHRFERLVKLGDLEMAVQCQSRAVALTPEGHPHLPGMLTNLAVSYTHHFERLGELGALEKAIEYESQALALIPDGHPHLPGILANLGVSYTHRFERLGELEDLEKAIEYQSRAVALTPDGYPHLPSQLNNLAMTLNRRFECLGELEDLEKAIEYQSRAVALTPDGHPHLSGVLTDLAMSYTHRFKRLGELGDLDKSIEYESRALALTPDGHPHLSGRLQNLGMFYSIRFRELCKQQDLDKAIEYMSRALELTPHDHPDFPRRHFPLADNRFLQYLHTGDPSHLRDSLYSYRIATQSLAGSPRDKFRYAIQWAKRASEESSLNCIEAYQTAITLLPQFVLLGATTIQRYRDLTSVEALAVDAALAAILASDYALALEWLEHARCVVWNQNLMLRSPLDKLYSHNPALATRLQTVAAQLHHAGSEARASRALVSGSLSYEQASQQHRQLAQEYSNLMSQARTLPGFEDFLQPIKSLRLVRAARTGPIVVITCHESRCDALIVMPGQDKVSHVPLPSFTGQKARVIRQEMGESMRNSLQRERGVERRPVLEQEFEFQKVLACLWDDVVKPVLDYLGYTNIASDDTLPHITWCPTGVLSFLPLHAAGDYDKPQSRIFDYVISSYTPTLTALLSSTPSSLGPDSRVLAIGQPYTSGHSVMPGTIQELTHLKDRISGIAQYSQLIGDQATTTAVLDAMKHHEWVHLACHAHQNISDPTKSGFSLHDRTLDMASINQQSFKSKGLAYLSACQTATGYEKLSDEAIYLAPSMLMAGYSSIIATMWAVPDDDAPFVVDKVYTQLMKDGKIGNGEAGKALHYAIAKLREKVGEKEFGRWVPYIHVGS